MSITIEDRETKIISFVGLERCDIVHYISDYGIKQGKKVLIIDNSYANDLYLSYVAIEDGIYVEIEDLMIVKNIQYSEKFYSSFDYVFVYHGMNLEKESYENSDRIYLMTNYEPAEVNRITKMALDIKIEHNIIFRDKVLKKTSEEEIIDGLGINVANRFILPLDISDYGLYLKICYNSFSKMCGCSQEMYDTILNLGIEIYSVDMKTMKKILKK